MGTACVTAAAVEPAAPHRAVPRPAAALRPVVAPRPVAARVADAQLRSAAATLRSAAAVLCVAAAQLRSAAAVLRPAAAALIFAAAALSPTAALAQADADAERWLPLFNGRDLEDWVVKIRGYAAGDNFADTFRVDDGLLTVAYDGYADFADRYGHIFYKAPFSHYRLRVEYRFV
ncbi:MAG: DUF1080 domain-containing protein, partial [Gammaproteobacteria bacterium]|nr:DUF1080 domain-containing protein [Gammaproteobacteria bacterium]